MRMNARQELITATQTLYASTTKDPFTVSAILASSVMERRAQVSTDEKNLYGTISDNNNQTLGSKYDQFQGKLLAEI